MKTPGFWFRPRSSAAVALAPLSGVYQALGHVRHRLVAPERVPGRLVVVGNILAGGAGKTPVTLALAEALLGRKQRVHLLAKGYGGRLQGPVQVDPQVHTARDVGDEPLLLAQVAPTWVAHDRGAGWRAAASTEGTEGAALVISDDGLQSPRLKPTFPLLVMDGVLGVGNGFLIPAGPLRESLDSALSRVRAVVQIGGPERTYRPGVPVVYADFVPRNTAWMRGARVLAFAGLGRPEKFFATCTTCGAEVVAAVPFPDHHLYSVAEVRALLAQAERLKAVPVTTTKDAVRLPADMRPLVRVVEGALAWRNPAAFQALVEALQT